jgi:hypothetical protein
LKGETTTRRGGAPALASLALLITALIAAANYFAYIFFQLYLDPWFWPTLSGLVTAAVLTVIFVRASREELGAAAALKALVFTGPLDSGLPSLVWVFWGSTVLISFRPELPYLVWPAAALALALTALVITFVRRGRGRRYGLALPLVTTILAGLLLGGKLYLDYAARRIDAAAHEQLESEIELMLEEAEDAGAE